MEAFDHVVVGLGALGSATCMELARLGRTVLGLEQFELGHSRGASHDTSRILRHSYHTPAYVRMTLQAYDDWARLERDSRTPLVTTVGGLDLFPSEASINPVDYTDAMTAVGIEFETLIAKTITKRWPQFWLPEETLGLYQRDAAILPAAAATATMQKMARRHGADLRDHTHVTALEESAEGVEVQTSAGVFYAGSVVVCADAWTNQVLASLDVGIPLEVRLEQVSYFRPAMPSLFEPGQFPLWIWMDDPSFYGFPCFGEPTVKAAQDCGGPAIDPDERTSEVDDEMERRLASHMASMLPVDGTPVRSLRCQYTLTPDRDFVVSPVPGHPAVSVGLGAAHAFKFAPTLGRALADLATGDAVEFQSPDDRKSTEIDLSPFQFDRPALTDPTYQAHWLV
jgi:sarcosine oxidase